MTTSPSPTPRVLVRKDRRSVDLEKRISLQRRSLLETPELRNARVQSVAWRDVSVVVEDSARGGAKMILDDACGVVRAGEMMAIMGPSGSGKTTLLNVLAQRHNANASGQVLVNGKEQSAAMHRSISAYVEQEDTLLGSMTTLETLRFAARLTISKSLPAAEIEARVRALIDEFGLEEQTHTLVGTPFRAGLSGGQRRRVSVAAHLITHPSVLFLDEPTSGLDSTASYEIMSYLRNIAKQHNIIVIASIHQPSTKTFDLFDQVSLLSQGQLCYCGPRVDLPDYFAELDLEVPAFMNPAEHVLDLVNTDFAAHALSQERRNKVTSSWDKSVLRQRLLVSVQEIADRHAGAEPLMMENTIRPGALHQTAVLLHRAWIKSYRDVVAYWFRVAMYLGLAVLMGTVWLRLPTTQDNIQAFVNAIFFGSAFMSFMAVAYVPAFLEDRAIFVKERANGLYGPTVFMLSNFLIGIPYLFLITLLFSLITYWLCNFNPTATRFFTWILWLFLDLLAAESLVVLIASLIPNFVAALAVTAFANGLWMCVGGFLVPLPALNVFWKYAFHYWDYQAYVFQGMMVNEFGDRAYACGAGCHCMLQSDLLAQCQISGTAVLREYGFGTAREGHLLGIMVAIIAGYRLAGWAVTWVRRS